MNLRFLAAPLPMLAAACAMQPGSEPGTPAAIERTAVTYSTQPCYGFCPVYSVRMTNAGDGVFEGQRNTAVAGERRFTVDPATAERFLEHLGAVRPSMGERRIEEGGPDCGNAPTDMPSIDVKWVADTDAAAQSLHLYLGCRSEEADRVRAVLQSAPDLLPIAAFIGKR